MYDDLASKKLSFWGYKGILDVQHGANVVFVLGSLRRSRIAAGNA
jgi:hypothetical protein